MHRPNLFALFFLGAAACAPPANLVETDPSAGTGAGGEATSSNTGSGGNELPESGAGGAPSSTCRETKKAYVGFSGTDQLVAFDAESGTPGARLDLLPAGDYPYDVTFKPDGSEVWVVGASGNGIAVIDTADDTMREPIDLIGIGEYPVDVAFSPAGDVAYVASRDSDALVVIDTATYGVSHAIPTSEGAGKMVVDRSGAVYFVAWYAAALYRYDPETRQLASAVLGTSLWDLALAPDDQTLYIADRGADSVLVVDTATLAVVDSVVVGDDPWGIDITPDGATLVVACEDDATLRVMDTTTLAVTSVPLAVDADPRDVEVTADGKYAFVPGGSLLEENDFVYRYDLQAQKLASVDLGDAANANVVAVSPCLPAEATR